MLNYLQFCYYKVNKILEAANAAKSQELLTPNDENAKKNVQYYMGKVLETGHKDFQGSVQFLEISVKPNGTRKCWPELMVLFKCI